jgi:putative serine protease PepD
MKVRRMTSTPQAQPWQSGAAPEGTPQDADPAPRVHWWGAEPEDRRTEPTEPSVSGQERSTSSEPPTAPMPPVAEGQAPTDAAQADTAVISGGAAGAQAPVRPSVAAMSGYGPGAGPGWIGAYGPAEPYSSPGSFYGSGGTGGTQPPIPPAFQAVPSPAPRQRHRWLDLALAAVIAAVVAGGTTAAVMHGENGGNATTTTSSSAGGGSSSGTGSSSSKGSGPVVQAAGQPVNWTAVAKAVEPSVVAISVSSQFGGGEGSGVILDAKGHVLTNNHVATAGGANGQLSVTLYDGRTYGATIVGTDPSTDLAVLQIRGGSDLTPATLGNSDEVQVGSSVMAVGNPLGLAGTVTTGIVSALDRPVTTTNDDSGGLSSNGTDSRVVTNAIQTDAAVNPGNSGGALVDSSGKVIGIPSSIASLGSSFGGQQSGSIGLGFSIPINEAKSIADQLIAHGKAEHPLLGVTLRDGTVKDGSATRSAAVIAQVSNGTPAATAGLRSGDAIIKVDGELVNGSESLVAQIRARNVGSRVTLTIMRGGNEQAVTVTLSNQ